MKFIVSILLIALLSYAAGLYLPWYSIAIAAFVVAALVPQKPWVSFVAGFVAVFLLWGGLSAVISNANEHVLAQKLSQLILKTNSPALLIVLTACIGGLVAGMGALTGSFVRGRSK